MKNYRIVKETTEKTKTVTYHIEKYWEFLCWNGWRKVKGHDALTNSNYPLVFDSQEKAQKYYDEITEKTIIEILN